jgi:hypothetical protein
MEPNSHDGPSELTAMTLAGLVILVLAQWVL